MPGSGARPARRNRAAARRERNAPPPRPAAAFSLPAVKPLTALWAGATAYVIYLVASGLGRKITWYLAVDQYGYLAFAHDLIHGHIFHYWPPLDALSKLLPARVDVLSQTYVWDHGRLYCRYAPGFPIILAGWLLFFGDDGAHYLNPTVYILLLCLMLAFYYRLFRSRWRATAGMALVIMIPTTLHYWGITLVRDLPTQVMGILGLFLVLPAPGTRLGPRRAAAAGLALGYAVSIRPDAALYLVPAVCTAIARWRRERAPRALVLRALATGALGVLLGVSPFLGYNWIATGNPFHPTQGMEFQNFFQRLAQQVSPTSATAAPPPAEPAARIGYPPGAWHGTIGEAVQGGGLKLDNFRRVAPDNFRFNIVAPYGALLLWIAAWGAILALARRRILFLSTVPYVVLAFLFYSCWSRQDARYLSGIYCLLPALVVEGLFGTLDLVRWLARGGRVLSARHAWPWSTKTAALPVRRSTGAATLLEPPRVVAMAAAVALVIGAFAFPIAARRPETALPALTLILPLATAVMLVLAASWPERRIARLAAPALALGLVVLAGYRAATAETMYAAFQRPQMLRARSTLARFVGPHSVVITTEDVGRPGENIDYYSGVAHAFYITDLMRWQLPVIFAARLLLDGGLTPYLLLPPSTQALDKMLTNLRTVLTVDLVVQVPPRQAMDYFVAAPFLPGGIAMNLYRITRK